MVQFKKSSNLGRTQNGILKLPRWMTLYVRPQNAPPKTFGLSMRDPKTPHQRNRSYVWVTCRDLLQAPCSLAPGAGGSQRSRPCASAPGVREAGVPPPRSLARAAIHFREIMCSASNFLKILIFKKTSKSQISDILDFQDLPVETNSQPRPRAPWPDHRPNVRTF